IPESVKRRGSSGPTTGATDGSDASRSMAMNGRLAPRIAAGAGPGAVHLRCTGTVRGLPVRGRARRAGDARLWRSGAAQLRALRIGLLSVEANLAARRDQDHRGDNEQRHTEPSEGDEHFETAHRVLAAVIQKPPAARIDGTHKPTNRLASWLSVNQSAIESRNDASAASRNSRTPKRCRSAMAASFRWNEGVSGAQRRSSGEKPGADPGLAREARIALVIATADAGGAARGRSRGSSRWWPRCQPGRPWPSGSNGRCRRGPGP